MHLSALEPKDIAYLIEFGTADPDAEVRTYAAAALRRLPLSRRAARTVTASLGVEVSPVRAEGDPAVGLIARMLTGELAKLLLGAVAWGDYHAPISRPAAAQLAALDYFRSRYRTYPSLERLCEAVSGRVPPEARPLASVLLARCSPADVVSAIAVRMSRARSDVVRRAAAKALAEAAPFLGLPGSPPPESLSGALADVLLEDRPPGFPPTAGHGPVGGLHWQRGASVAAPRGDVPPPAPHGVVAKRVFSQACATAATSGPPQEQPARPAATRTAHARLDAPGTVTVGDAFSVAIGLAPSASTKVIQPRPFAVPTRRFTLGVQLMVDGFIPVGGATAFEMPVSPENPFPSATVTLIADDRPELSPARTILAVYTADGRDLGVATRSVHVTPRGASGAAVTSEPALSSGEEWPMPANGDDPDVTIVVKAGDDAANSVLLWSVRSKHAAVPVPATPVRTRIDDGVSRWASRVRNGVEALKNSDGLHAYLRGVSAVVGDSVPKQVWTALAAAARLVGRPTVLLTTAEPYIPWELARVPEPWIAGCSPYLGAQTAMGRWIYRDRGHRRAPEASVEGRGIAVVKGTYRGARRLPEAEAEADHLCQVYGATVLPARFAPVYACLKGDPEVAVLHFAVHGRFDPDGIEDGILLEDGDVLDPHHILGADESRVKIVVLNACQVGQGQMTLGDYAGMAAAFLSIGVHAVVAPLWKVDDAMARDIATRLYAALRAGTSPADFFADVRKDDVRTGAATSAHLAYLYFGHPRLRVAGPFTRRPLLPEGF